MKYLTAAILFVIAAALIWSNVQTERSFRQFDDLRSAAIGAAEVSLQVESRVVEISQHVEGEGDEEVIIDLSPGVWSARVIDPYPKEIGVQLNSVSGGAAIVWNADVHVFSIVPAEEFDGGMSGPTLPRGPTILSVDKQGSWAVAFERHQCPGDF